MDIRKSDFRMEVMDDDPDQDFSYLEQPGFEKRLSEYKRGDFTLVGVRAVFSFTHNGCEGEIRSSGVWGVESDNTDEAFGAECIELMDFLEEGFTLT